MRRPRASLSASHCCWDGISVGRRQIGMNERDHADLPACPLSFIEPPRRLAVIVGRHLYLPTLGILCVS